MDIRRECQRQSCVELERNKEPSPHASMKSGLQKRSVSRRGFFKDKRDRKPQEKSQSGRSISYRETAVVNKKNLNNTKNAGIKERVVGSQMGPDKTNVRISIPHPNDGW